MENSQEKKKEEIKYQGRIHEIVERTEIVDNKELKLEFSRRAPGTRLIVETANGKIILTKEWRYELNNYDYRLPGGKVFDTLVEYNKALESGEDISQKVIFAAQKEAKEEVGVIADSVSPFAISKCGATVEWDLHYLVLKGITKGEQDLEHGEKIEVGEYTKNEAKEMCMDGKISEERSAMNLLRYLEKVK